MAAAAVPTRPGTRYVRTRVPRYIPTFYDLPRARSDRRQGAKARVTRESPTRGHIIHVSRHKGGATTGLSGDKTFSNPYPDDDRPQNGDGTIFDGNIRRTEHEYNTVI